MISFFCHAQLTKSVCTLQASFNKTNEHQTNELQSLSTQGIPLATGIVIVIFLIPAPSEPWIQYSTGEV